MNFAIHQIHFFKYLVHYHSYAISLDIYIVPILASHVSAISYIHKICDVPDPTQHFLVRKLIKCAQNLNKSPDNRMSITKPILLKILSALPHSATDNNNIILLRAVFLLAFHGFFRLGEPVSQNNLHVSKDIRRADVSFIKNQGVQIILRHFKNMKNNQPITISLTPSKDSSICPVHALQVYISNFGHTNGPLFSFQSGTPVPHSFVITQLKSAIEFCGLNTKFYKGHSFRIGAATEAAKMDFSENYIQQLGRWHSNAIKRYIRINSFTL